MRNETVLGGKCIFIYHVHAPSLSVPLLHWRRTRSIGKGQYMQRSMKFLSLVAVFVIATSSSVFACHSDYFNEVFAKVQKQQLNKAQLAEIVKFRSQFNRAKSLDHQHGKGCSAHDSHVPAFIASAAGVLSDDQFKAIREKREDGNSAIAL